jgi:glycosyltransferase involved in cell wall biosynthesis
MPKLLIVGDLSFPNGLAAAQRVKLISYSLLKQGFEVKILCTRANERPPYKNIEVKGFSEGIEFEYAPGFTKRPKKFLYRRLIDSWGFIRTLSHLIKFGLKNNSEKYVYFYYFVKKLTFTGMVFSLITYLLRIPILYELNEIPWSLKNKPGFLEKIISPLTFSSGVIAISKYLYDWAISENKKHKISRKIIRVPILVDVEEFKILKEYPDSEYVLFAGSPNYVSTIKFIYKSMSSVWNLYPKIKLCITGFKPNDPSGRWLISEYEGKENILLLGYLDRRKYLEVLENAYLLLIPLLNDSISIARFPTKIAEYLATSRAIVTTYIGEACHYLTNENAFLCKSINPISYGNTIISAIRNREEVVRVGLGGRKLALDQFNYLNWGSIIAEFIKGIN